MFFSLEGKNTFSNDKEIQLYMDNFNTIPRYYYVVYGILQAVYVASSSLLSSSVSSFEQNSLT